MKVGSLNVLLVSFVNMENVRQRRHVSEENDLDSKDTPTRKKKNSNHSFLKVVLYLPLLILLVLEIIYLLSPISAVRIEDVKKINLDGPFAVNTKLCTGKRYIRGYCILFRSW